jgi:hypothetical protein
MFLAVNLHINAVSLVFDVGSSQSDMFCRVG